MQSLLLLLFMQTLIQNAVFNLLRNYWFNDYSCLGIKHLVTNTDYDKLLKKQGQDPNKVPTI